MDDERAAVKQEESGQPFTGRDGGRMLACEMILRSRFGRRGWDVADRVGGRLHAGRRIRWTAWLSVAACLAIIAGSLAYNYRRSGRFADVLAARIREMSPEVEIVRDGAMITAVIDMPLLAGDRIRTGLSGRLKLGCEGEDTTIDIGRDSVLDIGPTKEGRRFHLETGAIDAVVAPQPEGRPLSMTTPHAEIVVAGTSFSVRAFGAASRLEVGKGTVRIRAAGEAAWRTVEAGGRALARAGRTEESVPGTVLERVRLDEPGIEGMLSTIAGITSGGPTDRILATNGWRTVEIDPATGRITREAAVTHVLKAGSIARNGDFAWGLVPNADSGTLREVRFPEGSVAREWRLPEGFRPSDHSGRLSLAFDYPARRLWMARGRRAAAVDGRDGTVIRQIDVALPEGRDIHSLAFAGGRMYVRSHNRIYGVNYTDGRVLGSFEIELGNSRMLPCGAPGGMLWLLDASARELRLIETAP